MAKEPKTDSQKTEPANKQADFLTQEEIKEAPKAGSPGSVVLRPTRKQAEDPGEAFYRLLDVWRREQRHTLEALAKMIGMETKNTASDLSARLRRMSLTDDQRRKLLHRIFEEGDRLFAKPKADDALDLGDDDLFFAFLKFARVTATSQDNARAHMVGTYKLFRYSVEHDGEIIIGKIVFAENENNALTATMYQKRKKTKDGVRSATETCKGYIFRVSHMYLMLLRDVFTNDVRCSIFPRVKRDMVGTEVNKNSIFKGEQLHIVQLDGFGLGIDGQTSFFSPVHLALVDDVDDLKEIDDTLDILPTEDTRIPKRVLKKLEMNGPLRRL